MQKKNVVIGLLGPTLDRGVKEDRWGRWRPTVSICQHEDFLVDRFELLAEPKFETLSGQVMEDINLVSPETDIRLHHINIKNAWDFEEVYAALHDFCLSYPFSPENESYFVHITTGSHVEQICMFLLTEARYFPARLLQSSPPRRRNHPTYGKIHMINLDLSQYDRLASRFRREQKEGLSFLKSGIDTRNTAFNNLIAQIERVAIHSQAPILLLGPTGAGKSQLAKRIFELKRNRREISGDFINVNCATIRGDAAMSALFGHVKGAFTGAGADRAGHLRMADKGILFLDEIGELGLDEQAMLLAAIEEKRFKPLGSDSEVKSNFQLIAGTNRDLWEAVSAGTFREDLLARINLWTFELPGLMQRREDIAPNLDYELQQFAENNGTRVTFSQEAKNHFIDFATSPRGKWKANFRDLNAAMTRMGTLSAGGRITLDVVREEIERLEYAWRDMQTAGDNNTDILSSLLNKEQLAAMDLFDRYALAGVVRVCRESANLSEAGRKLFAVSRSRKKNTNDADRLRKYLAKFDLNWKKVQ